MINEYDCRPENYPATGFLVHAIQDNMSGESKTVSDFANLGIDSTICNLGTDVFELSGPATSNLSMDV